MNTNFSKSELCSLTNIMMGSVQYSRSPSKDHALKRLAGFAEQNGLTDDLPAMLEAQSFKTAQEAAKALHKKMVRPASKKATLKAAKKPAKWSKMDEIAHQAMMANSRDVPPEAKAELAAEVAMHADEPEVTHEIVELGPRIDAVALKAVEIKKGWTKTGKGVYHKVIGDLRIDLDGKTATLTGPKGSATGTASKFYDACRAAEAAYNAL